MKKEITLTVLIVTMVLPSILFAIGKYEGKENSGKVTVTFAGTEGDTSTQSKMMMAVIALLNADGRFDAKVLVSGALSGDTNALVTQAKLGVPIVVPTDPGRLASQFHIPDLSILMAPYILTDPHVLKNLPDTALFKQWSSELENEGLVLIADMYNGFRNFYTTTKVEHVKDLSGMRIRGFGNSIGNGLAKHLGFENKDIRFGKVLPGIQKKTLDGTEVQVSAAVPNAFWEVTPYIAMTKHYMLQTAFVCSSTLLDSMSEDAREFFLATIREKSVEYGELGEEAEAEYFKEMTDHGVEITNVDIKEFQTAVQPLYTNNELGFSPGLQEELFKQLGIK